MVGTGGQRAPAHPLGMAVDVKDPALPCDCKCPIVLLEEQHVAIIGGLLDPAPPAQQVPRNGSPTTDVPLRLEFWGLNLTAPQHLVHKVDAVNLTTCPVSSEAIPQSNQITAFGHAD